MIPKLLVIIVLLSFSLVTLPGWASHVVEGAKPKPEQEATEVQDLEDIPVAGEGAARDKYVEAQKRAMDGELAKMKAFFELTGTVVDDVRLSLKPDLAAAVQLLRENETADDVRNESKYFLAQAFKQTIRAKTKAVLSELQLTRFNAYVEGEAKLAAAHDRASQLAAAFFLDTCLSLTPRQRETVVKMLAVDWNSMWNFTASISVFGNLRDTTPFSNLNNVEMKKLLSGAQFEVFSNLKEFSFGVSEMRKKFQNHEWDPDELKAICNQLVDLKIVEIHELCELSENQTRKFRVAKKGAIIRMVAIWDRYHEELGSDRNGDPPDLETNRLLVQPTSRQCTSQLIWRNAIRNVLTENQKIKFLAEEDRRRKLFQNSIVHYYTMSYITQLGTPLSHPQHLKMQKMLMQNISPKKYDNFTDAAFRIYSIPDEKFEDILSESQWEKFKPILAYARNQFKDMQARSDK